MLLSLSLLRREAQTVWEKDWQVVVPVLQSHGYRVKGFGDPSSDEVQPEKMDRSSHPDTKSGSDAHNRRVLFKVLKNPSNDNSELRVLSLVNSAEHRSHAWNHAVALLDTIKVTAGSDKLTVLVKENIGVSWAEHDASHPPNFNTWSRRVMQLLEFTQFLHSLKIAHLDLTDKNVHIHPESGDPVVVNFDAAHYKHDWSKSRSRVGDWPEDTASGSFDPFAADIWSLGKMLQEHLDSSWDLPDLLRLFQSYAHEEPRSRPSATEACDMYTSTLVDLIAKGRFIRSPATVPLPPDQSSDSSESSPYTPPPSSPLPPVPASSEQEQEQEVIEDPQPEPQPETGPSATSGASATDGSVSMDAYGNVKGKKKATKPSQDDSPELKSDTDHTSNWSIHPYPAPYNEQLSESIISQGVPKKPRKSTTEPLSEEPELAAEQESGCDSQQAIRSKSNKWGGAKQKVMRKLKSIPNFFSRE